MRFRSKAATFHVTLDAAPAAANAGVLELPWKANLWNKIRGSLKSIRRVYAQLACDRTPEQIVCDPDDLEALVAPFKKTNAVPANCEFNSYEAFYARQSRSSGSTTTSQAGKPAPRLSGRKSMGERSSSTPLPAPTMANRCFLELS